MSIDHHDQFDLGQVTYNGFLFPPALNSSVQCTPVYDDTDRSLMYMMYRIRVEFIIDLDHVGKLGEAAGENVAKDTGASKGSIDNQIAHLRRQLCQVGRKLHIANIGLGPDLYINDPAINSVWDVTWGPKPRVISWKPLGMNRACSVVWECEVGLVECENPSASIKERYQGEVDKPYKKPLYFGQLPWNILQLYYNQSWDISETGGSTKTYEAALETRGQINPADIRSVMDCADNYRVFFEPPLQAGFKRVRSYRLDNKKTRLDITITDQEFESDWPLPPGIVDIDTSYSISSSLLGKTPFGNTAAFNTWQASISGSFTLAKGFHPYWRRVYPYYLILLLIRSRYSPEVPYSSGGGPAGKTILTVTPSMDVKGAIPEFAIPLDFSITEDIFSRTFSFSFSFLKWSPPEEAAARLAFGNPPNQYVEVSTNERTQFATMLANAGDNWDWNVWMESVYGTGNDTTNNDFLPSPITLTLHSLQPTGEKDRYSQPILEETHYTFPVLGRWDNGVPQQPFGGAYSNRGFRGLWFEGDARQEPCMNNPDFWYQRIYGGTSATGNPLDKANVMETKVPDKFRVIAYSNQYEVYDDSSTTMLAKLNAGERNLSMAISNGEHGYFGSNGTSNYIDRHAPEWNGGNPDANDPWNLVAENIMPESTIAPVAQISHAKFKVRMFGYAVAFNKPCSVPRQHKFGQAVLIKDKSRSKVEQMQDRGNTQVYRTMWEIWYSCIGSPTATDEQLQAGIPAQYGQQGSGSHAAGITRG